MNSPLSYAETSRVANVLGVDAVLARVRISEVWSALGGGSLRKCRGCAFWRAKADSWSVAISDEKASWFDHRDNIGGGILDLVCHVRKCTRQDALRWVADLAGVTLDNRPQTPIDRARRARAQREAEALTLWRRESIKTLVSWRNGAWDMARAAGTWLQSVRPGADHPALFDAVRILTEAERLGDGLRDAANLLEGLEPATVRELRASVEPGRRSVAA